MCRKVVSIICLFFFLATSGCLFRDFASRREIREAKHISNFTTDNHYLYFGAGYKLYRLDALSQSIEAVYATNRIRVEQPIIAEGTAYFGGLSYVDERGNSGESQGFFGVDLQNRQNLWKFPLGIGGYGTFGTYPVLVGDQILVCARQHLYCLDRRSGKELWKLNNWLGRDSDGVTVPYVHQGFVYFKINEEYFTGIDTLDGHWRKLIFKMVIEKLSLPLQKSPASIMTKVDTQSAYWQTGLFTVRLVMIKTLIPLAVSVRLMWKPTDMLGKCKEVAFALNQHYPVSSFSR